MIERSNKIFDVVKCENVNCPRARCLQRKILVAHRNIVKHINHKLILILRNVLYKKRVRDIKGQKLKSGYQINVLIKNCSPSLHSSLFSI